MRTLHKIGPFIGPLALTGYVACTLAAYFLFPGRYSPVTNWLSDLGNPDRNPQGAFFYSFGVIFSGLLVILFFLGASSWKIKNLKVQNHLVNVTRLFGILGGLAMIVSALFPINLPEHELWSILLYVLLGTAFAFSVSALRYFRKWPRWVLGFGVLTAGVDLLSGVFHEATILEWITVGLFLIYLLTLSGYTRELRN